MYYHVSFILSKGRLLTHIVLFIYIRTLELSLIITGFVKKNGQVISSIIKGATGPKSTEGPAMGPATRLATGSRITPVMRLGTGPAMGPGTSLAIKPTMELDGVEGFLTGLAIRVVGVKGLSPS